MTWLQAQYARLPEPRPADEIPLAAAEAEPVNFGLWAEGSQSPAYQPPRRPVGAIAPAILAQAPKDTVLWPCLFRLWPNWKWGMQPTGDCTRWMKQHELDILLACLVAAGKTGEPEALVAGESIYGFAKCELVNSYRYHGAGATGWAVGNACLKFGTLYRRVYEKGSDRLDLTRETSLSIDWGDRGRGVPDWLEPFAAPYKATDCLSAETPEEAGKLVQAGYPVDYCGYTYWARSRGSDGIGTKFSSGWHAITATGVLWDGDQVKALWIANSGHGEHCSGPVGPFDCPPVYAACGAWVPRKLLAPVYAAGDCYAHTMVAGWPILDLPDYCGQKLFG